MEVSARDCRPTRSWTYWSAADIARHAYGVDELDAAARTLRELLTDSVRLRLRSDVPVGSCLSGGLDSATVVSLIRRLEPNADLRTFTGRFPGSPVDEGHYAHMVVAASRTEAHEVAPSPERLVAELAPFFWHAEFPVGGLSQFAQWCVFALAKHNGVTVLLDGQGSDEQLGGYGNAITAAFLRQLAAERRPLAWLRERAAAARTMPALFSWARLALTTPPAQPLRKILRRAGNRAQLAAPELARPDWLTAATARAPHAEADSRGDNALSRLLWQLSFRTMLSSLLRFGDRLSMAHSREVRLPFCDHRVAELAFQLSPELLVGNGEVKRVLRRAIDGLVPPAIVTRAKQGFVPPQRDWIAGPLAPTLRELLDARGPLDERIDKPRLRQLAAAAAPVRAREAEALWHALNLSAWEQHALMPMQALPKLPLTFTPSAARLA
jgi:asparagine synthase (glutamine-hydrolysing)